MARCTSCNKFVSNEENEPEVQDLSVDQDSATVTASVRIVNACADCGEELTEGTLEMEAELGSIDAHQKDGHELSVEEDSTERVGKGEGKGRYRKTFYGAKVDATVKCSCGKFEKSVEMSEYIQASSMDPLN